MGLRFEKMLLPSSGNVNDYVRHVYAKYAELDGNGIRIRLDTRI